MAQKLQATSVEPYERKQKMCYLDINAKQENSFFSENEIRQAFNCDNRMGFAILLYEVR